MPFQTPRLDDLTFQEIVDHAKRLIPRYCPEWTDHNVSDPGVTLIELFASMVEMLLYRVNQLPDKVYLSFLNAVGARAVPPAAAQAEVTFYLTSGLGPDAKVTFKVPAGTEVTTARVESHEPVLFTTRAELTIHPARLTALYRAQSDAAAPIPIRPGEIRPGMPPVDVFTTLNVDEALYLAFDADLSGHALELTCDCVYARGLGSRTEQPPIIWEARRADQEPWRPCLTELDETRGLNQDGRIVIHLAETGEPSPEGVGHLLRCRLTDGQVDPERGYRAPPQLTALTIHTIGATVMAAQEAIVTAELLGESDGSPGQSFQLHHGPLLSRASDERLEVRYRTAEGKEEASLWQEVPHFSINAPDRAVYTLDDDGMLTLGPLVRAPDGEVKRLGRIPPRGSRLIFTRYRYGGGFAGNVPAHTITVLKSNQRGIKRVTNHSQARGGRDRQSLDDVQARLPELLGLRSRAVTADDVEHHAAAVPGVARARCLAPGRVGAPGGIEPGRVKVLLVPALSGHDPGRPLDLSALELKDQTDLGGRVARELEVRMPLGCALTVQSPTYRHIRVEAEIWPARHATAAARELLRAQSEAAIYRFLSPITGDDGAGWPFERTLRDWEIANTLRSLPLVAAANVSLVVLDGGTESAESAVALGPDQLLYLERAEVHVSTPAASPHR